MTTSAILFVLYSGHALFAVSDTPVQQAVGYKTSAAAVLPEHLQVRERSARGLAETGHSYDLPHLSRTQEPLLCLDFPVPLPLFLW